MTTTYLTEVARQPAKKSLRLGWSDGFTAECGYDELRGYCPCAGCQGHYAKDVSYNAPENPVEPVSIEPVGNYAISIHWSDGHSTGIYRFDFLRHLCSKEEETS
jgi:DUF971 family protein